MKQANFSFIEREGLFTSGDITGTGVIERSPERVMRGIADYYESEYDKEAAQRTFDRYGLTPDVRNTDTRDFFAGHALARANGIMRNPAMYFKMQGLPLPETAESRNDFYEAIGADYRQRVKTAYDERKAKEAEQRAHFNEFARELESSMLKAVHEDGFLNADILEKVTRYQGDPEQFLGTLDRAKNAARLLRSLSGNEVGGKKQAEIYNRAKELEQEWYSETHFAWTDVPSWEDFVQRAKSDLTESVMMSREVALPVLDALKDEDGNLDERAFALFHLALDEQMYDQRSIDSEALRAFGNSIKSTVMNFSDAVMPMASTAPVTETGLYMGGSFTPTVTLDEYQKKYYQEANDRLQGAISKLEKSRLTLDERASVFAGVITGVGEAAGETLPYMVTGPIGAALKGADFVAAQNQYSNERKFGNYDPNTGTFIPEKSAEAEGFIDAGVDLVSETVTNYAARKATILGSVANRAIKRMGIGVGAKAIPQSVANAAAGSMAAYEGNVIMRLLGGTAAGATEELVREPFVGESFEVVASRAMQMAGIDVEAREWDYFATVRDNFDVESKEGLTQFLTTVLFIGGLRAGYGTPLYKNAVAYSQDYSALRNMGLSPQSARRVSTQRDSSARMESLGVAIQKEVIEDPEGHLQRVREAKGEYIRENEMALYREHAIMKEGMKAAGVLRVEPSPDGEKNLVTVQDSERYAQDMSGWEEVDGKRVTPDGYQMPTKEIAMTDAQVEAVFRQGKNNLSHRYAQAFRSGAYGRAFARAADGNIDYLSVLDVGDIRTQKPIAELAKSDGIITVAALKALSDAALEYDVDGTQLLDGVANATVAGTHDAIQSRIAQAVRTGEMSASEASRAGTNAFRLPKTGGLGESLVIHNAGHSTSSELSEEVLESHLSRAITQGVDASKLWGEALELRRLIKSATGKDVWRGMDKVSASQQGEELTEFFSHLAQSDFYKNYESYNLPESARAQLQWLDAPMKHAHMLRVLGEAFNEFKKTDQGKAWISRGNSLSDLLKSGGHEVASLYDVARIEEADVIAIREAQDVARVLNHGRPSLADASATLETYEQEQVTLENDDEGMPPDMHVTASDSITGEALDLSEEMNPPKVDAETGEMDVPQEEVIKDEDGKGRGLLHGQYVPHYDGSVIGAASVDDIHLSADVPQFKKKSSSVGRVNADEDGTTHALSGGFNHSSAPIHVWRREGGRLEIISGRHRLAHAKRNGIGQLMVRVYDESPIYNADWAKLHDVEQNILDGTCNAIDIAYYFTHNPITTAEAEARGLMPKTQAGEATAAARVGLTVASSASQEVKDRLFNGDISADDAYMAVTIASTPEGQALALQQRNKGGKTQSWDYVTAFVRGVEAQQSAGAQLDLFGNDTSWQETAEKTAKYVSKARAILKEQMQVIRSGRKLEKQAKVAKRLGVEVKNPEDAAQLLQRLALLDAAYERMDGEMGIPAKVEVWDGKSTPEVSLADIPYSYQKAAASFALSEREQMVVNAFDKVDAQPLVEVNNPEIYTATPQKMRQIMKDSLDSLKTPTEKKDKKPASIKMGESTIFVGGSSRQKISSHSADRRVASAFCQIKEIAASSVLVDKQENSQSDLSRKSRITGYQYFLNKVRFSGASKNNASNQDEAYVLMVVEERANGDLFHDINVRNVQVLDTIEATLDVLPELRVTKAVREGRGGSWNRIDEYLRVVKRNREKSSYSLSSTPRLAPNGKPSNLNEKQWHQVRTPEFKAWFGDWENAPENASKVVDENGEPKVYYHGTWEDFSAFAYEKQSNMMYGEGFYFTGDPSHARAYGDIIMPVFLNARYSAAERMADRRAKKPLKELDHIRVKDMDYIAVQTPTQIKSAIGNRGTFNASNPDITFSIAGKRAAGFDKAKAEGRTFIDPADRKEKFIIKPTSLSLKEEIEEYINSEYFTRTEVRLEELITNNSLFVAYPEIKKMYVTLVPLPPEHEREGRYISSDIPNDTRFGQVLIAVNNSEFNRAIFMNVLGHEIQHAIQDKEGFSGGTMPLSIQGSMKMIDMEIKHAESSRDSNRVKYLDAIKKRLQGEEGEARKAAFEMYENTRGEQESRFVGDLWEGTNTNDSYLRNSDYLIGEDILKRNSSYSLRSMSDVVSVASLGKLIAEEEAQRLIRDARAGLSRWQRIMTKDNPTRDAARALGSVQSLLDAIYKRLEPKHRPKVSGYMKLVEAYARMIERGKIASYGALNEAQKAELTQEVEAELEAISSELDLDEIEALLEGVNVEVAHTFDESLTKTEQKKRDKERLTQAVRTIAEQRVSSVVENMLNDTITSLESQLIEKEDIRIQDLIDRLMPKKGKSGKLQTGKMSADAYKQLTRYIEMMEASADNVSKATISLEAIISKMATDNDKDNSSTIEAMEQELMDWTIFGNAEGMNLAQKKAVYAALRDFALMEKTSWQVKQEDIKKKSAYRAMLALEEMGYTDASTLAATKQEAKTNRKSIGGIAVSMMSTSQKFKAMTGTKGLENIGAWSLDTLAKGNERYMRMIQKADDERHRWFKETLGLSTENEINDWLVDKQQVFNTGITNAGRKIKHKLSLPIEEARRWVAMSKQERDLERARIREEYHAKGHAPENIIYEEDIELIKAELKAIDDMRRAAAEQGKKGKHRTRVHTARETRANSSTIVASKLSILDLLLRSEQQAYERNNEYNGYTPEVLAQLREFVGDDVLAYGAFMRSSLQAQGLHENVDARMGINFPRIENYWPGRFDQSSRMSTPSTDGSTGEGTRYPWQIERVAHTLDYDLNRTATDTYYEALASQLSYVCYGELTAEWRRLLSQQGFAQALRVQLGESFVSILKEDINGLDQMWKATSSSLNGLGTVLRRVQSGHAVSVLAGSPFTIMKQFSAVFNGLTAEGISYRGYVQQLLKDRFTDGAISYKELAQMDMFKIRHQDTRIFTELEKSGANVKWSRLSKLARTSMNWMSEMDALSNITAMRAVYNLHYQKLHDRNKDLAEPLSDAEMREDCERVMRNALETGAQPLLRNQKSSFAAQNASNAYVGVATYMSSDVLNKVGNAIAEGYASGGGWRGAWKAYKYIVGLSVPTQLIAMVLQAIKGDLPDENDDWLIWGLSNFVTAFSGAGLLNAAPFIGPAVSHLTGGFVRTNALDSQLLNIGEWKRRVSRGWRMASDDRDYTAADWTYEAFGWVRALSGATGWTGGMNSTSQLFSTANSLIQSVNAAMNTARPAVQRWKEESK